MFLISAKHQRCLTTKDSVESYWTSFKRFKSSLPLLGPTTARSPRCLCGLGRLSSTCAPASCTYNSPGIELIKNHPPALNPIIRHAFSEFPNAPPWSPRPFIIPFTFPNHYTMHPIPGPHFHARQATAAPGWEVIQVALFSAIAALLCQCFQCGLAAAPSHAVWICPGCCRQPVVGAVAGMRSPLPRD